MRILSYFFSKKTILLHFSTFTILTLASGQMDSTFFKKPDTRYYSIRHGKWWVESKLLQLSPEIHGFKYLTVGLNLVEMKAETGEGGGNAKAYLFGFEYLPTKNIIAPKVAAWKGGYIFGIGGKIGINGLYYFKKNASSFAFRPMIGFGLAYFQFNYGYTFFSNKKFEELSPHSFSLSWHHLILPKMKNK
ncbi:MAG: hypothetical protein AB8H03_21970 [Saprospiraceae bacterium]